MKRTLPYARYSIIPRILSTWDDNMIIGQGEALRSYIYVCVVRTYMCAVACVHKCTCMWGPDVDFGGLSLISFHLIF